MARKEFYFSSESVSNGNPDKICDQVVENILDAYMEKDQQASVNINSIILNGKLILGGEIKSSERPNIEDVVSKVLSDPNINQSESGIKYSDYEVENRINFKETKNEFTRENVVEEEKIITGFAINDSDVFMPITLTLAHTIIKKLNSMRNENRLPILPDAKTQITIQYDSKGKPKRLDSVVINTQHKKGVNLEELRNSIIEDVIYKTIPNSLFDNSTLLYVNPAGTQTENLKGSVMGISGRKTVIDTYGSWARFGGDSICGKDPHKLERSVSYMLRKIAKNFVASGLVQKIEIQTAYAPAVEKPIILYVDTYGTGKISDDKITKRILELFDLNPLSIVNELELLKPIYHKTACYGHFGRNNVDFTWEMIDKADELK